MILLTKIHKHLLFAKIRNHIDKQYRISSNKNKFLLQTKHAQYINHNFNVKTISQRIRNTHRNETHNT